jgi:hypothetical protein
MTNTGPSTPAWPEAQFERISPHRGEATFRIGENEYSGQAEFIVPADRRALVVLRDLNKKPSQNMGADLVIAGSGELGAFRLECSKIFVYPRSRDAWPREPSCFALPINGPVRINYGQPRNVTTATVVLENFDYEYGDPDASDGGFTRNETPLSVNVGDRRVIFRHRPLHDDMLLLVKAGELLLASLTEFSTQPLPDETDDELIAFGRDVAGLCTFAIGASVNVALAEWRDGDGAIVRRVIPQPVASRFRRNEIIDDFSLPDFFEATSAEFMRMKTLHPAWCRLASYCGSIEDAAFLEQKFASLVMALEFFMRNSLLEKGHAEEWVAKRDFNELIGAARKHLAWDIPKHYVTKDTIRLVRNAVMHGGELPTKDSAEFRWLFEKWRLFLYRRVLMRLGYKGEVLSPHKGWRSSSPVGDFSEDYNTFTPTDSDTDSFLAFLQSLKKVQRSSTGETSDSSAGVP